MWLTRQFCGWAKSKVANTLRHYGNLEQGGSICCCKAPAIPSPKPSVSPTTAPTTPVAPTTPLAPTMPQAPTAPTAPSSVPIAPVVAPVQAKWKHLCLNINDVQKLPESKTTNWQCFLVMGSWHGVEGDPGSRDTICSHLRGNTKGWKNTISIFNLKLLCHICFYTSSSRASRGRKFQKKKELYSKERICL